MERESYQSDFISVIVPVFNSAESLALVHDRMSRVLGRINSSYEIIFVDDASTDNTWSVLRELCSSDYKCTAIRHKNNAGQGGSVLTGMAHAQGHRLITMDDDLEQHPEQIPQLLASMDVGFKNRLAMAAAPKYHHSRLRQIAGIAANLFSNFWFRKRLPLYLSTFCAFDRSIAEVILADRYQRGPFVSMLVNYCDHLTIVDVQHQPSVLGGSRYSYKMLFRLFIERMVLASQWRLATATIVFLALIPARNELALLISPAGDVSIVGSSIGLVGGVLGIMSLVLYLVMFHARKLIRAGETDLVSIDATIRNGVESDSHSGS